MTDTSPMGAATPQPKAWQNKELYDAYGNWLFSVTAIIIMPLLPLLVEAVKHKFSISSENLLLTSAVLAVGFGFSSEDNLFRAAYLLLFFFSIGLDFGVDEHAPVIKEAVSSSQNAEAQSSSWLFSHPGYFVAAVCILHAIERLNWHVAQKKRFPDWLNGKE